MIRTILLAVVLGGRIGLIGYDLEIIVRGEATFWTYVLTVCGLVGLAGIWLYFRDKK